MHTWLDRTEYPFSSHSFDAPAGRMHYIDEGDSEHVLVMVHGNPTWSFAFRHLVKALSNQYRCVVVDHLGFGLSDKPTDWDYFPESHAANLTLLLHHLNIQSATLMVEDWGGPIGLSYAIEHPEQITSLILMNTWLWPVNDDPYYKRFSGFMGSGFGRFLIRRFNFFARVILKQAYGDRRKLTRAIHQHYLRPLASPADRMGSAVFPKRIIASGPWLKTLWEHREAFAHKPTLVLWGMKDIAFREQELNTWRTTLHQGEFHELADVGHFVHEEAHEAILPLVQSFLNRHETAAYRVASTAGT